MLALLRKVDKSFSLVSGQPYTAINCQGFEVDILRREQQEQDPHPRTWATPRKTSGWCRPATPSNW